MHSSLSHALLIKLSIGAIILLVTQRVAADSLFNVGGDATLATDYVFRGASQTMSGAALQGSITVEHDSGLFGTVWASNVDFTPKGIPDDGAILEVDFLLGYNLEYSERLDISVNWVTYQFPNTLPTLNYNYNEWIGSLVLDDSHSFSIGYSSDVFASEMSGTHYAISTGLAIRPEYWLGITVGHYDLRKLYSDSYTYGELSVEREFEIAALCASFHATSKAAKNIFDERIIKPRIVLTLSTKFN